MEQEVLIPIDEQVAAKAAELTAKYGVKVNPIIFTVPDIEGNIIGYLKEPPRFVKLRIMDKGLTAPVSAASEIVDAYLIREESDPRIYSEDPNNDRFYIGATMEAYATIKIAINQFKKK